MGDGTRVVRAGLPAAEQGAPFLPPPTPAGPFHLAGDPEGRYQYGRFANPSWSAYERAIGGLEGGDALVFASGMAAVAAVLFPLFEGGGVLVAPADGYPAVRALATEQLRPLGVETRLVATHDHVGLLEALPGAAVLWLETPSNPALDVCDIAALTEAAHAAGALVAVDNTLATPIGQRPLALGADVSVTSGSKALTGHADLILGVATWRDPERAARCHAWRTRTGSIAGPFETWLAHRSLATLEVRLERQCTTAVALAQQLLGREELRVRHPGLAEDPAHEIAARQMERFGPVVGIDLETRERAERFLAALTLVTEATSFGGVHSTAERRARWGQGDAVSEGFVRFSCGIEDTGDVIADVERALEAV